MLNLKLKQEGNMFVMHEKIIFKSKPQRLLWSINKWFCRIPRLFKINSFQIPTVNNVIMTPMFGHEGAYIRIQYTAENDYKTVIEPIGEVTGKYDFLVKMDTQIPEVLNLVVSGIKSSMVVITKLNTAQFQTVFEQMRQQFPIKEETYQQEVNAPDIGFNTESITAINVQEFKSMTLDNNESIKFNESCKIQLGANLEAIPFTEQLKNINLTSKI